jgi:aminoglycoside phosphotransferase (APT) family kinase protein
MPGKGAVPVDDDERLRRLAEARTSAPATIAAIIRDVVGRDIVRQERIIRGEANEVYRIDVAGDGPTALILRLSHAAGDRFAAERWAIDRAAAAGTPTATIIATGRVDGPPPVAFSLQTRLPGRSLDDLLWYDTIPAPQARRLSEQAGIALASIHSGGVRPGGLVRSAFDVSTALAELSSYQEMLVALGLTRREIDAAADTLSAGDILRGDRLLHGDFGASHVLVDQTTDEITGIIDFEECAWGDPALDLCSWNFWYPDESPIDWLLAGYRRVADTGPRWDERRHIADVYFTLGLIDYYTVVAPDARWAEHGVATLRRRLAS